MSNSELKKKRMLIIFIEAAQEIMTKDGIEAITLRKVSDLAGYNGATLYNYFDDLDQLILFASLKYLKLYNLDVVEQLKSCKTEHEKFLMMWETFCQISFKSPQPFNQIFFNKHSQSLDDISKRYYELFPEDIGTTDNNLKEILSGTKLGVRNKVSLKYLADEENKSLVDIDLINDMMIALYHDLLLKRISDGDIYTEDICENKMMEYVNFLLKVQLGI